MCVRVCDIDFAVFTDRESCTRPISENPASMEAGECGLTRGTCFSARRVEVVAAAGLMWVLWCVFGGAGFIVVFQVLNNHIFFSNSCTSTRPLAATDPDSSQRRLGQGAPTGSQSTHPELSPTSPHQVYRLVCSHLGNMACHQLISKEGSLIFVPTNECNLNKFFSSFESAIPICSRERTLR